MHDRQSDPLQPREVRIFCGLLDVSQIYKFTHGIPRQMHLPILHVSSKVIHFINADINFRQQFINVSPTFHQCFISISSSFLRIADD